MLRRLLHLLLAALLALAALSGGEASRVQPDASAAADDCCPDGGDGRDCCDWDLGACCASGLVAAVPAPPRLPAADRPALPSPARVAVDPSALHPREHGPPPTRPPIG